MAWRSVQSLPRNGIVDEIAMNIAENYILRRKLNRFSKQADRST